VILFAVFAFSGLLELSAQPPSARPKSGSTVWLNGPASASPVRPAGTTQGNSDGASLLASLRPSFLKNEGQFDAQVRYRLQSGNLTLWVTGTGLTFDVSSPCAKARRDQRTANRGARSSKHDSEAASCFDRTVFVADYPGISPDVSIEATWRQPGSSNFFGGADTNSAHTGVGSYAQLLYRDAWPGIDIRLIAGKSGVEQEFVVHRGADPGAVQVAYRGVEGLSLNADGALVIATTAGTVHETQPKLFQEVAGKRRSVSGRFRLDGTSAYRFEIGPYDTSQELVIDPTLLYSTFLGGSDTGSLDDAVSGIVVDSQGNTYLTGATYASNFPTTPGTIPGFVTGPVSKSNTPTAFITKLSAMGNALVYSAYISGPFGGEGHDIGIDSHGNAYVVGWTAYRQFPLTPGNVDYSGCIGAGYGAPFVLKIGPKGDQLLSAALLPCSEGGEYYYGGRAIRVAVDQAGGIYYAKTTSRFGFPISGGYQTAFGGGSFDIYVAKFTVSPTGVLSTAYQSYLGGAENEFLSGIAIDTLGNMYVTGQTLSTNFPTTSGAFLVSKPSPGRASFVAKINPSLQGTPSLVYSTFVGGNCSAAISAIDVDAEGRAVVGGVVGTDDDPCVIANKYPTTPGAFRSVATGPRPSFVTKLNVSGSSLVWSTFLSSTGYNYMERINALRLDSGGNVLVAGGTNGLDFPITPDAIQPVPRSTTPSFFTKLDVTGSQVLYSTFLGGATGADYPYGIAVDALADAYVAGGTRSADFPTTAGVFQRAMSGTSAAFVTKFTTGAPNGMAISSVQPARGGNSGQVTLRVVGYGFHYGVTAKLICGTSAPIIATIPDATVYGRVLEPTFTLVGVPPGTCDLAVANPDGTQATRPGSFTVEQGGAPDIQLEIVGRFGVRGGVPSAYSLIYTNRGTVNSGPFRIWISFPEYFAWSPPPDRQASSVGQLNGMTYIAFDIPSAGLLWGWIPIQLTAPNTMEYGHRVFEVKAWREEQ
jgi:hypothetical protein